MVEARTVHHHSWLMVVVLAVGDFSGKLRMMMVVFGLLFRVGVGLLEGVADLGGDDKAVLLDNRDAGEGGAEAVARTCSIRC